MNIYTYYENINFSLQNELLEIWGKSWEKYGFNPIILSREDAQKSDLFNQYYDFVQRVHEYSVGSILPETEYWLAAQLEIVAFHTVLEPSYFSDYDMINNGFLTGESLESLVHWRNDACSCFSSGNKYGWERYIKFLFNEEQTIIDWCKESEQTKRKYFGDQDFLIAVRDKGINNQIYKMYRNLEVAGAPYSIIGNTCKVPHLSHENMQKIKYAYKEYSQYSQDELRILLANKILFN